MSPLNPHASREPGDAPRLDFADIIQRLVDLGGSDLHVKAGNRPLIRIHGVLQWLDEDAPALLPSDTEELLHDLLPETKIAQFESDHEIDFSYTVRNLARFRVNAYLQRGTISIIFRVVPFNVRSIADLGLPPVIGELAEEERGIVLVTGATGSGKSATMAAMVRHINERMFKHIVCVEDPIEYVHVDQRSSVDQREVGSDTESFRTALRRVMRQDPDVIVIGEIRDEQTARTAMSAAETGHLVLGTLHTLDAPESINRLIDLFPADQERQVRSMLAGTVRGIVSQRLVPAIDEGSRVAVCEVLRATGRVHDMIMDSEQTARLTDVIAQGEYYEMQTFDQALYAAVKRGAVDLDEAVRHASKPADLKLLVATEGHLSTTMDDVERANGSPAGDEQEPDDAPSAASEAPAVASVPPPG